MPFHPSRQCFRDSCVRQRSESPKLVRAHLFLAANAHAVAFHAYGKGRTYVVSIDTNPLSMCV